LAGGGCANLALKGRLAIEGAPALPVTATKPGARPLGTAYIALAALVWSLAGILQRQLHMSLASQLAGRAAFALLAILVFVAVAERGQVLRAFRAIGRPGLAVAVLMAVASGSFITALNDTSVANVLVIQALVPLAAALLGRLAGDPVRRTTWMAMGVAVAGFAVMAGAPTRPGLLGTLFSVITMLTFATTIVVVRHKADVSMAPATCLSQVLVLAMFGPFAHVSEMGGANLFYLALLGIVQMGLGLFFLSLGARLIPAADVALISQLENVLGPLWVWLAGIERPSAATIAGGIVVIGAVVFQVLSGASRQRPGEGDVAPQLVLREAGFSGQASKGDCLGAAAAQSRPLNQFRPSAATPSSTSIVLATLAASSTGSSSDLPAPSASPAGSVTCPCWVSAGSASRTWTVIGSPAVSLSSNFCPRRASCKTRTETMAS
jgi:drug/metabolite transporter (DMT)-like permease